MLLDEEKLTAHNVVNKSAYSVTQISNLIKSTIDNNFSDIRVRGEISGLKVATSGHAYFSLKEDANVLGAVCWRGKFQSFDIKIEEGMEVICSGSVTTFAGQSKYQLIVSNISINGVGALMALLEKRKKLLASEGIFDDIHKQKIPLFPKRIAVITSPTGVVIKDILHRIAERFPTEVVILPVAVQGTKCPSDVVAAIGIANEYKANKFDLIIIARGGGSIEDLWGFNDEQVVRAVFNSKIPIISAIGHETDYTLLDLVADKRAPTPTAAAEFATPDVKVITKHLSHHLAIAANYFDNKLYSLQNSILFLEKRLKTPVNVLMEYDSKIGNFAEKLPFIVHNNMNVYASSFDLIISKINLNLLFEDIKFKKSELDMLWQKILSSLNVILTKLIHKLHYVSVMLEGQNYQKLLQQGYSILRSKSGNVLSSINEIENGESYKLMMADGEILVKADKL